MGILQEVRSICHRSDFREGLVVLLQRICAIDTSSAQSLARLSENEAHVFAIVGDAIQSLQLPGGSAQWRALTPAIQDHPAFSRPYYAEGTTAEIYEGRGNLLFFLDRPASSEGLDTALNAHIDTVAPYFPPERTTDRLYGRGAVDDKGNVVVILGALAILAELERRGLISLRNRLTAMFVIDEETGGNGSLDLALDRALKERYDSLLVLECASNQLYPANRGAVFLRCAARLADAASSSETPSLLGAFALGVLELVGEGEAIRLESNHPLFPHRPVQTCTGILGPWGNHPSAICGEVGFEVQDIPPSESTELYRAIQRGIQRYVERYGDKTTATDPDGRPKVERHFDLQRVDGNRHQVTIYGSTGHMGSLPENDAAITKWAYVMRELGEENRACGRHGTFAFPGGEPPRRLVFEGAQGFLPTHSIEEVKDRTRVAFLRGVAKYLSHYSLPANAIECQVTFDKLHNNAYAGDPGSASMRRALRTAAELRLVEPELPVRGWEVSCDARLFADEYPSMPVITTGVGKLDQAHANHESVRLDELFESVCFLSMFILRETGALL